VSQHLFIFTIGPVQSFIAQARKTQDLYTGSFLLSHLIGSAMDHLNNQVDGCDFIFPYIMIKFKPNRFIAKVESEDIGSVGKELESFVKGEFEVIASTITDKLNLDKPHGFESQIKDHLQANWVAIPLEDYVGTYRELESYLGAIKNVRAFQQLGEVGRKCSLCGERNVLFYRGRKRAYTDHAISLNEQPPKYMVEGEGLCAVCFTKRFADKYFEKNYERDYPSTAEISLMDSFNKMDKGLLDGYKKMFGDHFDEELYFEDNLTKKYFEKYEYPTEKLEDARSHLEKIARVAGEKKVKPSRYYAILMLDGDSMGRWLSGEFLGAETQFLEDFHKKLTEQLGTFSKVVDGIVKKPKGKLVYAGGDDVLAFVNLNHLLPVMRELREKFPKFEEIPHVHNQTSSASCGVCIAHYKTPLSEALKWARMMEKEAKSIDGKKDAFAIAVLKRSGEIRKTVFKWKYNDANTAEILGKLIQSLKEEGGFSNTFIKNLGMEFGRVMDEEGKYEEKALILTEMERLIDRSCTIERRQGETKEEFLQRRNQAIDDLTKSLRVLYVNSKSPLDNFLSFMDIADFIERGGE